ncbi:MAG: hypothetical protein J3K34DRAFT_487095 [Monoraphidium minutum]|nr:MAG: hypothetical protein J3K34DRAFT_487095 [Monoraphidium minutum]
MFLFGGKTAPAPGARVPPSLPVRVLSSYARTAEEVALFGDDIKGCSPVKHLEWDEALDLFPDGHIPSAAFEHDGCIWQLTARAAADGRRVVHLATPLLASPRPGAELAAQKQQLTAAQQQARRSGGPGGGGGDGRPPQLQVTAGDDEPRSRALVPAGGAGGALRAGRVSDGLGTPSSGSPVHELDLSGSDGSDGSGGGGARNAGARARAASILGRYKALIALIEHCKGRASGLRPGPGTDWGREPAHSLLHAIVDVGEALAGFGNASFPERSGEARAVLAADYKALLSEYLRHLGGVLAPGACRGLAPETEAELRSVGSLLATRCEAYKVLYEQLVAHVGTEGRGGAGGWCGPAALIFNTNSNAVDASPVTTNHNAASAASKAKALNQGIGAAALAAAALGVVLLARALMRGAGGGRSRRGDGGLERSASPRRLRLPAGRNGRELGLVSALSACGDELRKAARNESLLQDDWRLGKLRLAWPPAPAPAGYAPMSPDVCDVTGVLQELYGR